MGCTVTPLAAETEEQAAPAAAQEQTTPQQSADQTTTKAAAASSTDNDAAARTQGADDEEYTAPSPVELTGRRVNGTTIKLSWNKCERADHYLVYYVNGKGNAYKRICKTTRLSYTDTAGKDPGYSLKINSNSGYTYRVYAINETDRGNFSSSANVHVNRLPARTRLMTVARAQLGKGYSQSRRIGPRTFDCSGYVWYCYNKSAASKTKFKAYNTNGLYRNLRKYVRKTSSGRNMTNIRRAQQGDIVLYGSSTSNTTHAALVYSPSQGRVINAANPRKGVCYGKSSWYGKVVAIIHRPDNN